MSSELCDCVKVALEQYFRDLDGQAPHAIYDMVMKNVERPMLEVVMKKAAGKQTVAAGMLGISRGTLRRLLSEHKLTESRLDESHE